MTDSAELIPRPGPAAAPPDDPPGSSLRAVPMTGGVALSGEVDMRAWSSLEVAVRAAIEESPGEDVLLELSEITFIDGHAVGVLAAMAGELEPGRRLVLRHPPWVLRRIVETLDLDREPALIIEEPRAG